MDAIATLAGNVRNAGTNKGLVEIAKRSRLPLAGLGVLTAAGAAAGEFDGEGMAVDTSQAAGRFLGDAGTSLGLAALGTATLGPVGTVAFPVLGALLGVQKGVGDAGAGLAGNVANAITNPGGLDLKTRKALAQAKAEEMQNIELDAARLEKLAPIFDKVQEMNAARQLQVQEQQMQMRTNYNFANSLNDSTLNRNAALDNATLIAMQELL